MELTQSLILLKWTLLNRHSIFAILDSKSRSLTQDSTSSSPEISKVYEITREKQKTQEPIKLSYHQSITHRIHSSVPHSQSEKLGRKPSYKHSINSTISIILEKSTCIFYHTFAYSDPLHFSTLSKPSGQKLLSFSSIPRSLPPPLQIKLRPAVPEDLFSIASIAIASWSHDPGWSYRFPYANQCPQDHWQHTFDHYSQYLSYALQGLNTILVAEIPSGKILGEWEIIAVSIWDNYLPSKDTKSVPISTPATPPPQSQTRKDASIPRLKSWAKLTTAARKQLFLGSYGSKQMSLRQMFTHPNHWGKGAATTLINWGKHEARKNNLAIPLFASKMGKGLYEKLGFQGLENVKIQVDGEEEFVEITAMVWES